MAERRKLTDDEIKQQLAQTPGWELKDGKLHREMQFGSFIEAFGFMTALALVAEKMDHHPEWFNVYNRVVMDLSTHDVGGVSPLDFTLAAEVNKRAP